MPRHFPAVVAVTVGVIVASVVSAEPAAQADPAGDLQEAVAQVRSASSCGALNYHPLAAGAAEIFNEWTDEWLMHTATAMPNTDPVPALHHLGYGGSKGVLLAGAAHEYADAVEGALLQGYAKIPDCSYTDFGVSVWRNERTQYYLTAVVLAGP